VAYFSMPETTNPNNMTTEEANSTVVINGGVLGNAQHMAQVIQRETNADIYRIEPQNPYPTDHATLAAQAREEQGQDFRPATKTPVSNMADYDVIFLGYPIWRADLPMPVYTFLESVDLSGKTIIPFGSHSGGFSRTVNAIAALQPDTAVSEDGLMLFRGNVAKAESEIAACVRGD